MVKKILVIDDEPKIVTSLTRWLEIKGYEVAGALGGKEGLAKAKSEKPDLIILDILMPDMNGHQVLESLRRDKAFKLTPVIILSVKNEAQDIVKSMIGGGAVEYVLKPFLSTMLLEKIEEMENGERDTARLFVDDLDKKIKKYV